MTRVIVSVTNDLSTDQRVDRVSKVLVDMGFEVLLVGRRLPGSLQLDRTYSTRRMRLLFRSGAFFYMEYNFRLFLLLLFKKAHVLLANDLDTLLANKMVSRIKGVPLVYDSHEYFTEVPELIHRPRVRNVWLGIERKIFPGLKKVMTVNRTIADEYKKRYGVDVKVVRNIPDSPDSTSTKKRQDLGLPLDKRIFILQGAGINVNRGAEEAIEAMKDIDNALLLIVGSGDVIPQLKISVKINELEDKVWFKDRLPAKQLYEYTVNCDIGLSLDKTDNLNYKYSLPNKLFDYINAEIPVLTSKPVEVERIVKENNLGELIDSHDPSHIADKLKGMVNDDEKMQLWKANARKAKANYSWQQERKVVEEMFAEFV